MFVSESCIRAIQFKYVCIPLEEGCIGPKGLPSKSELDIEVGGGYPSIDDTPMFDIDWDLHRLWAVPYILKWKI